MVNIIHLEQEYVPFVIKIELILLCLRDMKII